MSPRRAVTSVSARLAGVALGAGAAKLAYEVALRSAAARTGAWSRTNHRGEQVTLLEGPALAVGAATAVAVAPGVPARLRAAAILATLGGGAVGTYDDFGSDGMVRGFRGHLGALRRGRITRGTVKIVGMGVTGLTVAALTTDRLSDTVLATGVVAGSANLLNLLDLRPGRALKAGLAAGTPALLAGGPAAHVVAVPLGAAASLLPDDLGERAMLGDGGAHAFGALLGLAATVGLGRRGQVTLLVSLAGLTAASEVVSFTKVIDSVAPLRWFDRLGRRPSRPR